MNDQTLDPYPLHRRTEHRDACGVGFIAEESGEPSRRVIELSLKALSRLEHRGGKSSDKNTGDGAGILVDIPWHYFQKQYPDLLKGQGPFALAVIFSRDIADSTLTSGLTETGKNWSMELLGVEAVPVDPHFIGELARSSQPDISYAFFKLKKHRKYVAEQQCFLLRKELERKFSGSDLYFTSFSSRTMVMKGLLTSFQLPQFYKDLADPTFETTMAVFHERYSTNTNPSWEMAQPFRGIAHNGEINTIKGNRLWMDAREKQAVSDFWDNDIEKLRPFITPDRSDSNSFDEVFELLTQSGKHPWLTMMMMIPDPYTMAHKMKRNLRDFYIYHENFMEPWDGPAAIIFTDGERVGAKLDRNGLRPLRYSLTKSGLVIMASESGVVDIDDEDLIVHHHMASGEIFSVNLDGSGVHRNKDIKSEISKAVDYGQLLEQNFLRLLRDSDQEQFGDYHLPEEGFDTRLRLAFGWHKEALTKFTEPLSKKPLEPVGAMGDDTPPAFISGKDRSFFDYFYQTFAQVTNPPIDPIRERTFMNLYHYLGSEENIFATEPAFQGAIRIVSPILSPYEVKSLMQTHDTFNHGVVSCLFQKDQKLEDRLQEIQEECVSAVEEGCRILFLSDEHVSEEMMPIPSALSLAAVHTELVRKKIRSNVSLIMIAGDVYEDHHVAVLGALGSSAVYPYMAYEIIRESLREEDWVKGMSNYRFALEKGLLKTMAKMGISTYSSYQGSMLLHALGLSNDFLKKWMPALESVVGGIGMDVFQERALERHDYAFQTPAASLVDLGLYRVKHGGEDHGFSPGIAKQIRKKALRKEVTEKRSEATIFFRDFLIVKTPASVSGNRVESGDQITRRFGVAAMSFGALSDESHRALTEGVALVGGRSNTGEGGEAPDRYLLFKQNNALNAHTKQVASGRFGVKADYLAAAREIQIKIAQGAKPGEGGQLPGMKVSVDIATARSSTPGIPLISPPPHHDIYSIEDLAQLIYDLKQSNSRAKISVKLACQPGIGIVATGVAKAGADVIVISSGDGGTGATPLGSMKHTGMSWEMGLAETHQSLLDNNLRAQVTLRVDGGLKRAHDILVAAALGAEEFDFGTAALLAIGCVMVRKCHLNTCPVGIATQDPELRKRFKGKPEDVATFFKLIAEDVRDRLSELGLTGLDELIGRNDLLSINPDKVDLVHSQGLDLSAVLDPKLSTDWLKEKSGSSAPQAPTYPSFDEKVLESVYGALLTHGQAVVTERVTNRDRAIGTRLAGEIAFLFGENQFNGTIQYVLEGSAGQSLGAFLTHGLELRLNGVANDHVGKGMSGGLITIRMPRAVRSPDMDHTLIGNVALFGATGGTLFVAGRASERFAVRNSGATTVVEGIGNHGCEYMTRGTVIILGRIGENFGSGMTGGVAYIYNLTEKDYYLLNEDFVIPEPLNEVDENTILRQIERHQFHTGSLRAQHILDHWEDEKLKFTKMTPKVLQLVDYKALYQEQVNQRMSLMLEG